MPIPSTPLTNPVNERAPDIPALPALNSAAIGFRNTPKVKVLTEFIKDMVLAAISTIQL
jgi:hypothetical protein